MHRVAIIQSSYIPWKGFFDIIRDVDEFIFLDHVQFTPRDWRSRNRIKTREGLLWLTVPAGSDRNRRICDVQLPDASWQDKHWKTLVHSYGKAPHFATYKDFFEALYLGRKWESLSELNQHMTKAIANDLLGLHPRFRDSRELAPEGAKFDLILDLVRKSGATRYVSGPSAADYMDPAPFHAAGVELVYKDYRGYPEYPQPWPPFEHAVSILDLLFSVGPEAPHYIWGWRDAG
ncbi:MAG TPA: WbqC family protein [Lysobacter sp.]|nr:WbqC family protein [Lysobacter sp.]